MNAPSNDRASEPWHEPYLFYGTVWQQPRTVSMKQLVRQGAIDSTIAGVLAAMASSGVSIAIISPAAGAGKSTLLQALLEYAPQRAEVVYLRGFHDPFAFVDRPFDNARWDQRLMVANELSPHLPCYVWGETARRALDLARHPGYSLWMTAHAADHDQFRALWRSCLGRSGDKIATWDPVVVCLGTGPFHEGRVWSGLTLHVGGVTVGREAGVQRYLRHTFRISDHRGVCHALWNQASASLRDSFGRLIRFEESVAAYSRLFRGVDSAPPGAWTDSSESRQHSYQPKD